VLPWRLSNTLDASFCTGALEEAIETYGTPEIFNTDQGSQFTSEEFTGILVKNNIRVNCWGQVLLFGSIAGVTIAGVRSYLHFLLIYFPYGSSLKN
jgi:hypothetical protein